MKFISLFSGAMGLDLGLEMAGFEPAACNEIDKEAVATIRHNRPTLPVLDCSIADVSGKDLLKAASLRKIRLVVGGPPCQAFSVFGNRRGVEDQRGQLIFDYIRIVNDLRPDVFVMENVRGLLSMPIIPKAKKVNGNEAAKQKHGALLRLIFNKFLEIGYKVDCYVVNSVNYGAPQIRERLLLIGNRHGLASSFPAPRYSNRIEDRLPPFRTLGDAIGDGFHDPCAEVMNFSPRKLKYLSMVPPGGNWRSLPLDVQLESMGKSWYLKGGRSAYWRKLSFDFPSPTVVTMPNHAGTSMCHPEELRAITVGEAAAIQEFPRDWQFVGTTTSKFRQVGNAVPTRLGMIAGEALQSLFKRIDEGERNTATGPDAQIVHLRPHVRTRSFWKNGKALAGSFGYYDAEEEGVQNELAI